MSPALFAFFIFQVGCHVYDWASLDHSPLIYESHVAGIVDMCYHTQLLVWDGSLMNFWTSVFPSPPPQ
jgi:hypothetical protein